MNEIYVKIIVIYSYPTLNEDTHEYSKRLHLKVIFLQKIFDDFDDVLV